MINTHQTLVVVVVIFGFVQFISEFICVVLGGRVQIQFTVELVIHMTQIALLVVQAAVKGAYR